MKKALCILFLMPILCGCGRDASQLTVVTGIGVDGAPGDYQVGTEVIRLTGNDQSSQSVLLQADGHTVTDSIDSLVAMTGRSLYCNHAQVLVVGRETAEQNMTELLEELLRTNQYPVSLRVAVAKDTAAQVMKTKAVVSDLHSVELEDMIRQGAAQCLTPDMDICAFYQELLEPGIEGILPLVELREDHGEQVCTLAGTALFQGDALLTVLNQDDSRTLQWLRGESGGNLVTRHGLLEVTYLQRELSVAADGAKVTFHITLTAANSEERKEALMEEAEQVLRQQCESLLSRLKELGCDAVGFGRQLRREKTRDWDRLSAPWSQVFGEYPIQVEVKVKNVIWGRIWTESLNGAGKEGANGT